MSKAHNSHTIPNIPRGGEIPLNGGLVRLRERYDKLNPSEKKVASYILEHPAQLIEMSVAQLAAESRASQAAIVRLCKTLGLKGYQDLKIKVAGDLQGEETEGYQEIRPHDTMETLIQNVSNNNIQSIRDTLKILDPVQVDKAVTALALSGRIYFYGVGASNLIAMDAQHKFLRMGKSCFSFADPHVQISSAVALTAEDTVVGISYSGETKEVIRAVQLAKERGSTTISITKYGSSTLGALSEIPLYTSSTENEVRSGAMASRITQLNVIDILYLGVASRNYEDAVKHLKQSRRAIRNL